MRRLLILALSLAGAFSTLALAEEPETPVGLHQPDESSAPSFQSPEAAQAKTQGCVSCHSETDRPTMHLSAAIVLGCTDCHGGNAEVRRPIDTVEGDTDYENAKGEAHVPARYPDAWQHSPANPPRSYTLLNRESPAYVRFVNPGDLRVARQSCGACHARII